MSITILGGGSQLNKLSKISEHLNRNSRTVYVELTGNDVTGDGSVGNPFTTVASALLELTGTTRVLTIELGAGDHTAAPINVLGGKVTLKGLGRLKIDPAGGHLISGSNGATVSVAVDVVDMSSAAYPWAFIMEASSTLLIGYGKAVTIDLVNADAFMANGYGQNAYSGSMSTITSTALIPKFAAGINSEPLAVKEYAMTYTNLT